MTFYEFSKTRRMARTGGNRVDDKENRNACQISPGPPVGCPLPDNFVTYFFSDSAAVISVDSTFFLIHTFLRRRRPPALSGERLHPMACGAVRVPYPAADLWHADCSIDLRDLKDWGGCPGFKRQKNRRSATPRLFVEPPEFAILPAMIRRLAQTFCPPRRCSRGAFV